MKKRPVLHQLASLCIAASVFFTCAAFAQADTFTLPQQFHYPGLVFSGPLTFSRPLTASTTESISFTPGTTLLINKNTTKKPLESMVITPTLAALTTTQPTITSSPPTPTTAPTETTEQLTTPTMTPTPTPVSTTSSTYSPAPQTNPGGLNAADIFSMVNTYRASQGLPAFQQDAKTCSLAAQRAPQVAGEIATGDMHAGLKALSLPYWNTENIISMNSDQAAFSWWINDPIHHDAIVSHNMYSCIACSGNSCAEEFTSYVAK